MSDHNFEKQVQQKLEELKIPPADKVWSSIEVRIRKDKRRRRGLLLLPLFLLLIGGTFYFTAIQPGVSHKNLVQKSSSTKTADNNSPTSERSIKTNDKFPEAQVDTKSSNTIPFPAEIPASVPASKETTAKQGSNDEIPGTSQGTVTAKSKTPHSGSLTAVNRKSPRSTDQNVIVARKPTKEGEAIIANKDVQKKSIPVAEKLTDDNQLTEEFVGVTKDQNKGNVAAVDPVAEKKTTEIEANVKADSAIAIEQVIQPSTDSSSAIATTGKKDSKKVKLMPKFRWGANVSIGASNMVEGGILNGGFLGGIIGEEKTLVADVASNATQNNSPNNAPPPGYKPSTIEKGLSFSAGAFIQKSISKRFSISTGIQYSFYSTHIRVGNRVDSFLSLQNAFGSTSISRYYAAAPLPATYKYTNRFHFVELPLTAHLQLNKGNKMPVLWNAGVSLMYLVATNALHFDGRTGVYYRDNSLFNKLQANLLTGLSISLRTKSTMPIHIGPQFQWGLTSLMKHEVPDKKKLSSISLSAKIFLNK